VQTANHGSTWTANVTSNDGSLDGFTVANTITTTNGTVTIGYGGANAYSTGNTQDGVAGVTKYGTVVTSATDPAFAAGDAGTVFSYAAVLGLKYADFGTWSLTACAAGGNCGPAYLGTFGGAQPGQSLTVSTAIPTTGYASYWGGATGAVVQASSVNTSNVGLFYGTFGLTANFASGTLTGAITDIQVYSSGGAGSQSNLGTLNDIEITNPISGNAIRGNIYNARVSASSTDSTGQTASGFDITGSSGKLIGGFYGSAAQETSGTFYLTGGADGTQLVGSFGAAAGSDSGNAAQLATHFESIDSALGSSGSTLNLSIDSQNTAVIQKTLDSSPDGFTRIGTYLTSGGAIVFEEGGAQTYSANQAILGLPSSAGIEGGNLIILVSTDPAVTTAGGGTWASFGKAVGLQYTDFGVWTISPSSNTAGSQTPIYVGAGAGAKPGGAETTSMPRTGTASFSGAAAGYVAAGGTSGEFYAPTTLTANFATSAVTGTIGTSANGITVYGTGSGNNTAKGTMNAIGITATIGGPGNSVAEYSGTAAALANPTSPANSLVSIAGASGPIKGAFYGPTGQESAGTFQLSGIGMQVVGSFGVKTATPSDRRLKTDIAPAGRLANGLALYSWRYLGGHRRFTGVMAQDVIADRRFADAVTVDADGLMRVDYARVGYAPNDATAMVAEGEAAVRRYRATLH